MMKLITTINNLEQANAVLEAGADEIVVALKGHSFSALPTFTLEQISSLKKVSLLMNRLYAQNDLEELNQTLKQIASMEIEVIYFADPGMLFYAKQYGLEKKMIYRPETLMTNGFDAKWWQDRGILGVSISPLLTLNEVLKIAKSNTYTEVSIHGHLLMSVSRRKLLQAYEIKQDCKVELHENRNLTLKEEKRDGRMPVYENEFGTFIYSDFIQESFTSIQAFEKANVQRVLINSVFLSDEVVLETVKAYRAILDGANAEVIQEAYEKKFNELEMSSGYYGQKTIL